MFLFLELIINASKYIGLVILVPYTSIIISIIYSSLGSTKASAKKALLYSAIIYYKSIGLVLYFNSLVTLSYITIYSSSIGYILKSHSLSKLVLLTNA